jgi:hypothetical protein
LFNQEHRRMSENESPSTSPQSVPSCPPSVRRHRKANHPTHRPLPLAQHRRSTPMPLPSSSRPPSRDPPDWLHCSSPSSCSSVKVDTSPPRDVARKGKAPTVASQSHKPANRSWPRSSFMEAARLKMHLGPLMGFGAWMTND